MRQDFFDCIDRMEEAGKNYAELKGQSYQKQELKGTVFASVFLKSAGKTIVEKEAQARTSEDYTRHIEETAEAIKKELRAKALLEKEKCYFEALRSLCSLDKKLIERD